VVSAKLIQFSSMVLMQLRCHLANEYEIMLYTVYEKNSKNICPYTTLIFISTQCKANCFTIVRDNEDCYCHETLRFTIFKIIAVK